MVKHDDWLEEYIETGTKVLSDRLQSNKEDINEVSRSIRKLYIWMGSVGISLLLFFLTFGIAALRYVDNLNYAVQTNVKELSEHSRILDKQLDKKFDKRLDEDELKKIIKQAIQESRDSK